MNQDKLREALVRVHRSMVEFGANIAKAAREAYVKQLAALAERYDVDVDKLETVCRDAGIDPWTLERVLGSLVPHPQADQMEALSKLLNDVVTDEWKTEPPVREPKFPRRFQHPGALSPTFRNVSHRVPSNRERGGRGISTKPNR